MLSTVTVLLGYINFYIFTYLNTIYIEVGHSCLDNGGPTVLPSSDH